MDTEKLLNFYQNVRGETDRITLGFFDEDMAVQAASFASPMKWHLGHTTWFFEKVILAKVYPYLKPFNAGFDYIFNSYYNGLGDRVARESRGLLTRPSVTHIKDYRAHVDALMMQLIPIIPDLLSSDTNSEEIEHLIILGLNHEQQHQELMLMDIKYLFSFNPMNGIKLPFDLYEYESESVSGERWEEIPVGNYFIGRGKNNPNFSYDNEGDEHAIVVDMPIQISHKLITVYDWMTFIQQESYLDPLLWTSDGWDWVKKNNIEAPLYWKGTDPQVFTMDGWKHWSHIQDAPIGHISWYEANAFAKFMGLRLPTEGEWEITSDNFRWGKRWEHTGSAYLPYPRFKEDAGVVGEYNGKFMINQMVLRGASDFTPKGHSRKTYRNFFSPSDRWMLSGLRLIKNTL